MIGSVPASRRALAFADALEGPGHDEGAADADREQAGLLALTGRLEDVPRPTLDADVKVVQRAQLVAAMEAAFAGDGASDAGTRLPAQRRGRGAHRAAGGGALGKLRKSRLGQGLAAGGLSVGVAASALGGVAAASSDALPGDTLYGLKRGMEDFQLDMAGDDAERGRIHLDRASTRLSEAGRLMERGRGGAMDHESLGEMRRALSGMQREAAEGHRLLSDAYERDGRIAPMQALSSFTEGHRARWNELRDRLPVQLTDVGTDVTEVFTAMEDDVRPLHALLPEPPGTATTGPEDSSGSSPRGEDPRARESGTPERTSGPSASNPEERDERDARERSSSPSASEDRRGGGLLGEDGLLDPVPDSGTGQDGPGDQGEDGETEPDDPDVTLPPLLPGLLPGLGLDPDGR